MKLSLSFAIVLIIAGIAFHLFPATNHSIFLFINSLFPNATFWKVITAAGDGAVAGCVFYLVFRKHNDLLAKGLIGAVLGLAVSEGLKRLFAIPRPEHTPGFEGGFHLLTESMATTNYSMPSGHVITAFLLGTFLFRYVRLNVVGRAALSVLLSAIMMSRVALGVHWPADVIVGAGLGIFIALASGQLSIAVKSRWNILFVHFLYLPFLIYGIYKYFL